MFEVAHGRLKARWSLALAAWNAAQGPPLTFVGLDHIGEGRQLGLLWAVLGAAHRYEIRVAAAGDLGRWPIIGWAIVPTTSMASAMAAAFCR